MILKLEFTILLNWNVSREEHISLIQLKICYLLSFLKIYVSIWTLTLMQIKLMYQDKKLLSSINST